MSDAAREKQDKGWPQSVGADRDPPGGWVLVLLTFMCLVSVASWGMFLIGWDTS